MSVMKKFVQKVTVDGQGLTSVVWLCLASIILSQTSVLKKKNPNSTARSNGSHPSMTPCGNSGHCISSSARQKKLARPHISQKTECGNMPVIPAMWEAEVRGLRPY
jgi:hypothetical protein